LKPRPEALQIASPGIDHRGLNHHGKSEWFIAKVVGWLVVYLIKWQIYLL